MSFAASTVSWSGRGPRVWSIDRVWATSPTARLIEERRAGSVNWGSGGGCCCGGGCGGCSMSKERSGGLGPREGSRAMT